MKEARKVFICIERAQRAVRETYARFRAPLRIGVTDGVPQPKLSQCLVSWRGVAQDIQLELTEMHATELAEALQREELDAGFSFGLLDNDAIAQQPAWSYLAVVLTSLRYASMGV